MRERPHPAVTAGLELYSGEQEVLISLSGKSTSAGTAAISVKMSRGIAGEADVSGYVSRVGEIDAVLPRPVGIDGQSIDVSTVIGISGKELILWLLVRCLRQRDRSAARNQEGYDY